MELVSTMPSAMSRSTPTRTQRRFEYDPSALVEAHDDRKFKRLPAGVVWLAGQIGKSSSTASRVLNGDCVSRATVGLTCDVLGVDREAIRPKADAVATVREAVA